MIYERWSSIKYQYRNREFWCKGYYVDTTGKNTEKIKEYIKDQLKQDQLAEQLTEYIKDQLKQDQLAEQLTMDLNDPFTGK